MLLTRHPRHHGYLVDGQDVPSVTKILKATGLSPDYGAIDPAVLEKARERGVRVHAIADALDKEQHVDIPEEYAAYANAYVRFRYDAGFEVVCSEEPVHHPTLLYAGTLDSLGRINGDLAVVDRKATYEINHDAVSVQTAAYRGAWNALNPHQPCRRIFSLHLRKDGTYRLQEYDADEAWQVWLAALQLYRFKSKHRKGATWNRTS